MQQVASFRRNMPHDRQPMGHHLLFEFAYDYVITTTIPPLPQSFHGPLDFVLDYPDEPVPERKTNLDLLEQEIVSGSGISWAICKSAFRSRKITMSTPHHSVFNRPDDPPVAQPTVSKH